MFGLFGKKEDKKESATDECGGLLDPRDVQKMLENDEILLIDIREDDEFSAEHVHGAISWPLSRFDVKAIAEKAGEKKIILQCATGVRAKAACFTLQRETGKVACRMNGCLSGWKRAGLPTEKG